jgi:hypothetical protein
VAATYASLKITPNAKDALQRVTLNMSASLGRRLTMSDVLTALAALADRHTDELRAALAVDKEGTPQ